MNQGEDSEPKFIAALGSLRNQNISLSGSFNQTLFINSIGLPGPNGSKVLLPNYAGLQTIQQLSNYSKQQLEVFCATNKIKKSAPLNKADVYINGLGFSTKYIGPGSDPAIVNHTNRGGWENIAKIISQNINLLDPLILDYWNKRKILKIIQEDIKNNDPQSPFRLHQSIFEPYLQFFCFDGSGRGNSNHPADALIEYEDPFDTKTWTLIYKHQFHQYLTSIWGNLRFSIRSKGMPKNGVNSIRNLSKKTSVKLWTENFQGKERGSLHIRLR